MDVNKLTETERGIYHVVVQLENALERLEVPDDSEGYSFRDANGLSSPYETANELREELDSTRAELIKQFPNVALVSRHTPIKKRGKKITTGNRTEERLRHPRKNQKDFDKEVAEAEKKKVKFPYNSVSHGTQYTDRREQARARRRMIEQEIKEG